ncbi:AsmA family protein [Desulfovibrio mangrovi]|uniref:AsmA family protein n=1 Tax=Desulfovibrio mangrovi TaxID=2976983 RepID=UPI00224568DA|nr:AsmA family protein [Desulfovibrio mangrovi]UZP65866.1 AsmA family protein [Desulfovibrio mangrovi]
MGKFLKIFGSIVGACLLIVAVGTIALITLVNPNDFKTRIAEEVRKQTGRTVEFTGDITLSYFPWLGLETGPVRMANPDNFGGGDFLSLEKAGIRVKLMPLLKKDVQVSFVTVDGLKLNFIRNAKGQVNWLFTPQQPAPAQHAPAMDKNGFSDETAASPLEAFPALLVNSIGITRASISYTDEQSGASYALNELSLATSALTLGKPVDITLKGDIAANAPKLDAAFDFHTTLLLAHDLTRIELDNQTLTLDATGEPFPGGSMNLNQKGAMSYDLIQQLFHVRSFAVSAYEADLAANGKLNLADGPSFHGKVALGCALRDTLKALGVEVATTDPAVLDKASLSFSIAASPVQIALSEINGAVDDTTLTGALRVKQFNRPDIKAELAVTGIDVDRYLPPKTEAAEEEKSLPSETAQPAPAPAPEQGLPAETRKALRKLLLDAALKVGSLTVQKVTLTDVDIKATTRDGLIKISPCSANLFEGRYDADISADLRGKTTRSGLTLAVKDLQLAPITSTFMGEPRATGTANLQTSLDASGETMSDILSTLNGKGSFAVTDGAVLGVQILPDNAKTQLKDTKVDKADEAARQQRFDRLSGSYVVRSGRVTNKDLALVAPNIKGSGAGYVDLYQDKIDYKAVVRVAGLPKMPVTITGTLANPRYGFDATLLLKNTLKDVQNLLPIPGLFGKEASTTDKQQNGTTKESQKPQNPLEQLGKGLQQLFKQ